jgi:AcrR family transcriptional regulator
MFSERSYDEVSIDDLARSAGISKGLLYHYFPTKRDFYVAALNQSSSDLLAQTLTPEDGLAIVKEVAERPEHTKSSLVEEKGSVQNQKSAVVQTQQGSSLNRSHVRWRISSQKCLPELVLAC